MAAIPKTPSDVATASALHQIFVRDGERCWIVRVTDIRLMESEGSYTRLYVGGNAALVFRSLTAIEQRLNPAAFFALIVRKLLISAGSKPWKTRSMGG